MFISEAPPTDEARAAFGRAQADEGFVTNQVRLWAWRPDMDRDFLDLRNRLLATTSLNERERALVVSAAVSAIGDSYCSLAWGTKLAELIGGEAAAVVIRQGEPSALTTRETALVRWVRKIACDANSTTRADVDALRTAGFDDREIFEATLLAAYRLAFSIVNDALGASPDLALVESAPTELRAAVTFGRR